MERPKPIVEKPLGIGRPAPKIQTPEKPRLWTFSFRFWNQIEFFGLDKTDSQAACIDA